MKLELSSGFRYTADFDKGNATPVAAAAAIFRLRSLA